MLKNKNIYYKITIVYLRLYLTLPRPSSILGSSRSLKNFNLFNLYTETLKLLYLIISPLKTNFLYYLIAGFTIDSSKLFPK